MILSVLSKGRQDPVCAKLRSRDEVAWEQLVAGQHGKVYNMLLRLTGDPEAAADLTQEAFVAAYRSAPKFAGKSQPQTWLHGVALNCYRTWRREMGQAEATEEIDENLPDPELTAEELTALKQRHDILCDAVRRLPEIYRSAVALRYFAGVPAVEIAKQQGVDAGTIRWRLHQAVKKLWVMLEPQMGKEEPA